MPEITLSDLKNQIERKHPDKLYLLFGEETYLVQNYVQKICELCVGKEFTPFNFQNFDAQNCKIDDVIDSLVTFSFMADMKCVTLSGFSVDSAASGDTDKLLDYIQNPNRSSVFIMYYPASEKVSKGAKWTAFVKKFAKYGSVVQFAKKTPEEAEKLICSYASKLKCSLSRADAAYLVELCGNDLSLLFNETEKLCAYTKEGEITRCAIDNISVPNIETTVFKLSGALLSKKSETAYNLLNTLFSANEKPISILSALSMSYIDLYRVKAAIESGRNALYPAEIFQYNKREFVLKNSARNAREISIEAISKSLSLLCETDVLLKSSSVNPRLILEELIAKLMRIRTEG